MMEFVSHDRFSKEIAAFERRFHHFGEALDILKRLCEKQFHPSHPEQLIAPGKLHRVQQNGLWTLWKVELSVPKSGLRPNQSPRVWFVVKGSIIGMLCIATHIDNYSDNEINQVALERIGDIF